jgi:hypothetical protein
MELNSQPSNQKPFQLAEGIQAPNLEGISEGWDEHKSEQGYYVTRINVSCEHISSYFLRLISQIEEPGFFVIELPASETEESTLRKTKMDPFHVNVYYRDGITLPYAEQLFKRYERLLVNDGMVNFGFGNPNGQEVFVGGFKLFVIYSSRPEEFREALSNLRVPQRTELKTLMDNFGEETPGKRSVLHEDPDIWTMLDELKTMGFYLAETRDN